MTREQRSNDDASTAGGRAEGDHQLSTEKDIATTATSDPTMKGPTTRTSQEEESSSWNVKGNPNDGTNKEEEEEKTTTISNENNDGDFGGSDEEFEMWIHEELLSAASPQLVKAYSTLIGRISHCINQWRIRFRGNIPLWRRIFKQDRVVKEVIESLPIISTVEQFVLFSANDADKAGNNKITIVDLCSGKGYLSMVLSELLPPDRIEKCLLVDKQWPLCHGVLKPHHISWEHIYGDTNSTNPNTPKYFETWPIPLVTSKQDLKQSSVISQLATRLEDAAPGPILILAVHLCGTLSIQALKLFDTIPKAKVLVLKPCCLPGLWHVKFTECFQVGSYQFDPKDVCAGGKWTSNRSKGRWKGPPRSHLKERFHRWCQHLQQGAESLGLIGRVELVEFEVQTKGGYQNSFLFAEREPSTPPFWNEITKNTHAQV